MIEFLAIFVIIIEGIVFIIFYNSPGGKKAIYHTSYVWIIDFFSILSGIYLVTLSAYFYYNNEKLLILLPLFIIGSWQLLIHVVKWIVRNVSF